MDQEDIFLKMVLTMKVILKTMKPKHQKDIIIQKTYNIEEDLEITHSMVTEYKKEENINLMELINLEKEYKVFSNGTPFQIMTYMNIYMRVNSINKANSMEKVFYLIKFRKASINQRNILRRICEWR